MWQKTEKWSWWCLCGDVYGFVIEKRMDETEEGEKNPRQYIITVITVTTHGCHEYLQRHNKMIHTYAESSF